MYALQTREYSLAKLTEQRIRLPVVGVKLSIQLVARYNSFASTIVLVTSFEELYFWWVGWLGVKFGQKVYPVNITKLVILNKIIVGQTKLCIFFLTKLKANKRVINKVG